MPTRTPKPGGKKKDAAAPPPVDEKFQAVEVSTAQPATVVLLLDSPEPGLVCKACQALHKYAEKSEQNCVELQGLGLAPRLVKLLASPDKATRAHAAIALSPLAAHKLLRRVLYKSDCVPQLLELLKPEEELVSQERASFVLSQLAEEYSFKVELHKHSSHAPLVQLLRSPDPDVQRNGARTLCLLLENYQARPAFMEAGGIPQAMELLGSEFAIIQELVLKTLHSCMHNADCRKAFLESDGLAKLVAFIGNKECSELHVLGVSVLVLCLEDGVGMVALQGSGCLQQLLTHITSGSQPLMQTNAATALAKAANNSVNCKLLHEQEAEMTFLQLLSSEDAGVVAAGCLGLSAMSRLSGSRQRVGQEDGLAALVRCLGREEGVVRSAAVQALASVITEAPANCKLLSAAGGVEALVQLLGDSEAVCREFAANCITSMAPDDSLRVELGEGGAVSALVGCLGFADSAVQASAVEALGMLACDSAARAQLCASCGVAPLLALLASESEAVAARAVWTLGVAAQSSDVAEAACQMGALEQVERVMLQSGSSHTHKASAKVALERLLDSNLPAKYWINQALSHTDTLRECEFFDAGKARSSSRPFTPLSELMSHPLNLNHPVLTVSLLAKPVGVVGVGVVAGSEEPASGTTTASATADGSSTSVGGRSKSRQQAPKEGKSKKLKAERDLESRISEESEEAARPSPEKLPGLLQPDPKLWAHLNHTLSHIQPLTTAREQVTQLAKYVSNSLGGEVGRGGGGALGFELPLGELQQHSQSQLVPLGEVAAGSFQHRVLLFKVLCDQLGVPCSLVRGDYSRHWNQVYLTEEEEEEGDHMTGSSGHVIPTKEKRRRPKCYVVDLMFKPGDLLAANTASAIEYQHI